MEIKHEGLRAEVESMLAAGMTPLPKHDLIQELDRLGYSIYKEHSFNYYNTGNPNHWPARSCYIVEKGSSRSFAHIESRRDDNFKALQELRRSTFTVVNDRLWEL